MAVLIERNAAFQIVRKFLVFGARSNQTHFAFYHVVELRQFVDAGFANKASYTGNSGIAQLRFLLLIEIVAICHAAKLVDKKRFAAITHPLLGIKNTSAIIEFDGCGRQQHERQYDGQGNSNQQHIQYVFGRYVNRRWQ